MERERRKGRYRGRKGVKGKAWFFTVTDLTYNPNESIGWRDSYDRGIIKNIVSSKYLSRFVVVKKENSYYNRLNGIFQIMAA
jgi:hypothetical protein